MPRHESLRGRCLLVVEDEYLIAADLTASLESLGVEVIGPAASVEEALSLVDNNSDRLDGAVLDINLRNERVYPGIVLSVAVAEATSIASSGRLESAANCIVSSMGTISSAKPTTHIVTSTGSRSRR
jgi:ActR/RegA family two-component response regulator